MSHGRDLRRYLVIGASGFVGRHLVARLGAERSVATYRSHPFPGGVHFDSLTMRLADVVLDRSLVTHAFLLNSSSDIDGCARDKVASYRANVTSVCPVIDQLLEWGIMPVFASSDAVFDGTKGFYTEEDRPNPILTYGKQKLAIERFLAAAGRGFLVVRLAKVVGDDRRARSVLGEWMQSIERGETLRLALDQVFSPVSVEDVVEALLRLAECGATGTYHVCGPRPYTRLELLQTLFAEMSRYRSFDAKILPCSIRDFDFVEPRPLDTSMRPDKLVAATGMALRGMTDLCREFARRTYGLEGRMAASGGRPY